MVLGALAMEAIDRAKRKIRHRDACRSKRFWTEAEEQLLRERYADEETERLAADLGRPIDRVYAKANSLGLRKSEAFMKATLQRCGQQRAERGKASRFQKGMVPWNKGLKGLQAGGRAKETQFKKGSKPHTWLPIGSHRVSRDGYLQRKVSDTGYPPRDWVGVHILLWQEHHGPVPAGNCLCFKDGNKQNIALDNLELLTRAERMQRNTIHRYPPELKDAIRAVGKLKRTIKEAEHEEQA
ncbi:HNH endonuclease signature motif containing protein [Zestomonas carbonaria]|uniref:HNH nuclease domain-containing protein n=1 Tax=Zestomonas carbonaria TaxID=2762745 RepID=A0A7U7ELH1_9GAMM|nr:HNH endonuclease signature motif containing protein [Pseudomonas carbonaria]CAD5107198.1 hypothetical protein PSEWESI4_01469 [Pseudomonas carbonaria]